MVRRQQPLGLVYDTGALIAADAGDRRLWALHTRALQRGALPVVPAGCIVEAWRGARQANLSRLLDGCASEPLDDSAARRAGALRRSARATVSAVDATVVEAAIRLGCAVVTADHDDVAALVSAARRRVQIIDT